jgi:cytoskeletal protein CcmA (bactofilin family)
MSSQTVEPQPREAAHLKPSARGPGRFGPGLTVTGDVLAGEDLIIEGRLTGGLHAPDHTVTIATGPSINGRLFARVAVIEGAVQGEVTATALVEVAAGARVEADLTAPAVAIAEGAYLVGRIDMRRTDAAARVARYRVERGGDARAAVT